jgi:hypothetical protein
MMKRQDADDNQQYRGEPSGPNAHRFAPPDRDLARFDR